MIIKDLEGRSFEITDLDASIALVDTFLSDFRNVCLPSLKVLEERRLQYWQDFKEKLLALKLR